MEWSRNYGETKFQKFGFGVNQVNIEMDVRDSKGTLPKERAEPVSCPPNPLFEQVLEIAKDAYIDPIKGAAFSEQSGKFNCQIKSRQDAVDRANEVLETAGDPYTSVFLFDQKTEAPGKVKGDSPSVGIGLYLVPPKDFTKAVSSSENSLVQFVFPGGPADKAGLKAGDIILSVDGKSTNGLSQEQSIDLLEGKANSRALIKVDRDGKRLDLSPIRGQFEEPTVISQVVDDNVLYLKIMDFMNDNVDVDIKTAMQNHPTSSAFIIDLRGNPGGYVNEFEETASLFIQSGNLYYKDGRPNDKSGAGTSTGTSYLRDNDLISTTGSGEAVVTMRNPNLAGTKPIVILADGDSASASEMFIGALSDNNRAKVVGERTYGKGIMQGAYGLQPDVELHVTVARYRTPAGRWPGDANKNRFGILPDIEVKQDPFYVALSAADKQFRKALETVKAMEKSNFK